MRALRDFLVKWGIVVIVVVALASVFFSALIAYENHVINECVKQGFDQLLLQIFHNAKVTAPPTC